MKNDRIFLFDMHAAAHNIKGFLGDMTPEAFANDIRTVRAVAFEILALGESANKVSRRTQRSLRDIPWGDLRLVRNTIAHEHYALNPYTVWRTAAWEVPPIADILDHALRERGR